jgi:hypothetical protein
MQDLAVISVGHGYLLEFFAIIQLRGTYYNLGLPKKTGGTRLATESGSQLFASFRSDPDPASPKFDNKL